MRAAVITAVLAFIIAIAAGFIAQGHLAGVRANDEFSPVPASWYASLPRDPALATSAYLARIPDVMRERGEAVGRSRYWVLAARIVANLGVLFLFLYSGAASTLDAEVSRVTRHRWLQYVLYALAMLSFGFVATLPVEVCVSYTRYRNFGFSDQPFLGWLQDYTIGWASMALFNAIGIAILMALIGRRPRSWFLVAGAVYLALALVFTAVTPGVIEPLTNTYTPLADTALKHDILSMANTAGVPADNVYTDDASRRSRRLNGHVSGVLGAARITIDDTTLGSAPRVVEALAAHEMGHYVMGHPLKMVLFASVIATIGFAVLAWLGPLLIGRFGAIWHINTAPQTGAIAVFWLLFTAWGFVSDPLTNAYARVQEAHADAFSLNLAHEPIGLADFMIQNADIGPLQPTLTDLMLFYDHPSDAMRVRTAMQWRAEHMPPRER